MKRVFSILFLLLLALSFDCYLFFFGKSQMQYTFLFPVHFTTERSITDNAEEFRLVDRNGFSVFSKGCLMKGTDIEIDSIISYGFNLEFIYIQVSDKYKNNHIFFVKKNQQSYSYESQKSDNNMIDDYLKERHIVIYPYDPSNNIYLFYFIRNLIFILTLGLLVYFLK